MQKWRNIQASRARLRSAALQAKRALHCSWGKDTCSGHKFVAKSPKVAESSHRYTMPQPAGLDRVEGLGGFWAPHRGRDMMRRRNSLRGMRALEPEPRRSSRCDCMFCRNPDAPRSPPHTPSNDILKDLPPASHPAICEQHRASRSSKSSKSFGQTLHQDHSGVSLLSFRCSEVSLPRATPTTLAAL